MERILDVSNYLSINTKILVNVLTGSYKGIYDSRIEDIGDKTIKITIPTQKGVPFPILPGTEIEVSFLTEQGRFSFKSIVKEKIKENILLLKIDYPTYLFRHEFRSYFRVEARLKIKFGVLNFAEIDGKPEINKHNYVGIIKDISGGGARISTDAPIEIGDILEIDLSEDLNTKNEVVSRVTHICSKNHLTEAGVEFVLIKEPDRDKIIKYVFQRQIELKKTLKQ